MSRSKRVLLLLEESPAAHIRFFEGMRMALGFSVSHPGLEVLLTGKAVRAVSAFRPAEIGLPQELLEFFPLFLDLEVRTFVDQDALERLGLPKDLPPIFHLIDPKSMAEKIRLADIVIGFSAFNREGV
ncbi:MAG: DsrE family protein [Leptospirales bacterium]